MRLGIGVGLQIYRATTPRRKIMIREIELEYTVHNLVRLSRKVWGENATEYLAGRLESIITYNQMKVLIDSLKGEADE
jgi:hypothetical protein